MNIIRFSFSQVTLTVSLLAGLASTASAVDYTLTADGAIGDNTVGLWTGGPPTYDYTALEEDDDLYVGGGLNVTFGSGLNLNSANIHLSGTANLNTAGNRNLDNITINIGGSATMTTNANTKLRGGVVVNYDSSATSTSTGRFSINNPTAGLNMNSGAMNVGMFTSNNGGLLYLNGGDFSFTTPDVTLNSITEGSINFNSIMGSTLSYVGAADENELNSWFTSKFIKLDGDDATRDDFNVSFSDSTLYITTTAVPEPGTYALLAGCFGLAAVMLRRRRA